MPKFRNWQSELVNDIAGVANMVLATVEEAVKEIKIIEVDTYINTTEFARAVVEALEQTLKKDASSERISRRMSAL